MEQGNLLALPRTVWAANRSEEASLRRLVLEYYDREYVAIRRYLSFLSVNPETAREIVQESFLKLHEHLLANGDRTNLRAWLYRVAHNLARNAQMASHSLKTDPLDIDVAREACAIAASPEQELLAQERSLRLRRAMHKLSTAQKECLVLRAEGLRYREIAQVLNLSVSTVGENVQRGLEKLKEII
ncbi:MAG: RNA polymerase sigma factor [Bryobacteraceae bacterium]|jgi:RNA polymerase sigma-70 factor (ECF subfamily)